MKRWVLLLSVGCLGLAVLSACSTYLADLDRAVEHYRANEYAQALVLLELLSEDTDSLATPERAQYAYYRGMTYFRLERSDQARYWLGLAAAYEKLNQGSLSADEKSRVDDTLDELNKPWYGLTTVPITPETSCKSDADCSPGQFCDNGRCLTAPASPPPAAATAPPAMPATTPSTKMPQMPTAPATEPANK